MRRLCHCRVTTTTLSFILQRKKLPKTSKHRNNKKTSWFKATKKHPSRTFPEIIRQRDCRSIIELAERMCSPRWYRNCRPTTSVDYKLQASEQCLSHEYRCRRWFLQQPTINMQIISAADRIAFPHAILTDVLQRLSSSNQYPSISLC